MNNEGSINKTDTATVATIGFFDGVHRGHRFLIEQVKDVAKGNGMLSMVITFDKHPRQVLNSEYMPQLLSTLSEKERMIKATGVEICKVLSFNKDIASMSAFDFMKDILKKELNVKVLIIGYDNRFGHNREEGFEDYVKYGKELGIEVIKAKAFVLNDVNISSSVVRSFLSEGEIEMASMCLGYRYNISGKVVDGVKKGRKMGYPTANLDTTESGKLIPKNGVYAVMVNWQDSDKEYMAMMNIGKRPTFNGENTTIEVNILDYNGDLYGKTLKVTFIKRLRSEQKFSSESALAAQLGTDRENAKAACLSAMRHY